jgi:hypothetical protein
MLLTICSKLFEDAKIKLRTLEMREDMSDLLRRNFC